MPPKRKSSAVTKENARTKYRQRQLEQRRLITILLAFVLCIFSLGTIFGCFIGSAFAEKEKTAEQTVTEQAKNTNFQALCIKNSEYELDSELQRIMYEVCEEYGVPFALAIAVAEQESSFNSDVNASKTNDYGLMQINKVNFRRFTDIGIDPMTDEGNIKAGVIMLSEAIEKYGDYGLAVMAYNCGDNGAKRLWDKGIYGTDYSEAVISKFEKWDSYIRGV